jgi:hypothetical protein
LKADVLKFLKNLFGAGDNATVSPAAYHGHMAEFVEFLVLVQTRDTMPPGTTDTLLRIGETLSADPYCLGYLSGTFEALCQAWEIPPAQRRVITGCAYTVMFRSLLQTCSNKQRAAAIQAGAFTRALELGSDAEFRRGQFDGCTELMRYLATKQRKDMPGKMHEHLKRLATA